MNKYKLVPYLALSKEDAKLDAMQDDLAKLLQDPSIDPTLKRALYEDLIQRIARFKEDTQRSSKAPAPAPIVKVEPVPQFTESEYSEFAPPSAAPSRESVTQPSDLSAMATPASKTRSPYVDDEGFETPKNVIKSAERHKKKKDRKPNQVSPRSNVTTSRTRTGTTFTNKELEGNRLIGRRSDWGTMQARQTMSPANVRRPSMIQEKAWQV